MKIPTLPFGKKPAKPGPKKFSGLSQKKTIAIPISKNAPQSSTTSKPSSPTPPRKIFHSITIYTALIKSDIKHLLKIDHETYRKKQEHDDFMEEHFGKDWRRMK